jgi:hypothetical protein
MVVFSFVINGLALTQGLEGLVWDRTIVLHVVVEARHDAIHRVTGRVRHTTIA